MPEGEITRLIEQWQGGDRDAEDQLFRALYRRLYSIAAQCVRGEGSGNTLGATELVHEAYLRFRRIEHIRISDSGHFLKLSARVMRRIVVDRARARRAGRRGDVTAEELEAIVRTDADADQILSVDRALEGLSERFPRQALLVELRYFAGYSMEECATVMEISVRTARREWATAKVLLKEAIDGIAALR